ncbi:N-acyl amino acid synthase FeeM domain-containing protein [Acidocella sp.]|uniref:N-acyl amino acid synthase FeeM domain-containing protein n=1 Tax=Acidocella sp. TaxID=50710 RepID=UPI00263349D0|nr:hypothetical protein [Acidocella sp.]
MSSSLVSSRSVVGTVVRPQILESALTARLALDESTKADAYAIRHDSYLSGGFIDPHPDGQFSDADDLKPNNHCVVIYQSGKPVASVRLCLLDLAPGLFGWDEIPASRIFPEEVAALAASAAPGRTARLIEINRLVRHPEYANNYQLVFVLFRFVSYLLMSANADLMLSCVRKNHSPFYKRMHFEYVAGPRRYAGVKFETNLMACTMGGVDLIRAEMPIVGADPRTIDSYAALMAGHTVNVFTAE